MAFGGLFDAIQQGLGSLGNATFQVPVAGDMLEAISGVKPPVTTAQPNGDTVTVGGFNNPTGSIITPKVAVDAAKAKQMEQDQLKASMLPLMQQQSKQSSAAPRMAAPGAINTGQGQQAIKQVQMPQVGFSNVLAQRFGRSR